MFETGKTILGIHEHGVDEAIPLRVQIGGIEIRVVWFL